MRLLTLISSLALAGPTFAGVTIGGSGGGTNTMTRTDADHWVVSPHGTGHTVLVPYFTVQGGNMTLLAITNHDEVNGKVVKVRFRSAVNSDNLRDFTVLLSPGDVWTANISQGDGQLAGLTTTDRSCTLPATVSAPFSTAFLPPVSGTFTQATAAEWTREGHIEIITTANVPPLLNTSTGTGQANPLFTAIKQVNGTPPCSTTSAGAAALDALATDPASEADAVAKGLDTPSGELAAWSAILNVQNAFVSWSTEVTTLAAMVTATDKQGRGKLIASPQTAEGVSSVRASALTSDPLLVNGRLPASQSDFPDLSTPFVLPANDPLAQASQLGATLATLSVRNEYSTLSSIGGMTDWTFVQPLRRYFLGVDYGGNPAGNVLVNQNPFYKGAQSGAATMRACFFPNSLVEPIDAREKGPQPFDREGVTDYRRFDVGGIPAFAWTLCGTASVFTFNSRDGQSTLKATADRRDFTMTFNGAYQEGWVRRDTPGFGSGLPVIGSAYMAARGPVMSGLATNFGWTVKHRTAPYRP